MLFVEPARRMIFLVRVQLEAVWRQCLSEEHKTRPPTFAPLDRIDKHPIEVRTRHGQKGDNLFVASADPNVAAGPNHFAEDCSGLFQRKRLPRAVPHANDSRLIPILERPDRCARVIHG
jgi:hypothetical protein